MTEKPHENIYQKMARIRKNVEVLKKDRSGYGYDYVSDEQILAQITGMMDKLHISLVPEIVPGTSKAEPYHYTKQKFDKDSRSWRNEDINEIIVQQDMLWHWVNNDDPQERITVPWYSVGQQADASQAFGSGLSYSSRYFKLVYFNVATTKDDPDNWRSRQKSAEVAEQKAIAMEIISKVDTMVNDHLKAYPDDRDAVILLVKKYAKEKGKPSANYNAIVDPALAAKLQADIQGLMDSKDEKGAEKSAS